MSTRVEVSGRTLTGVQRQYNFELIPALTGVRIVHEYGGIVLSALPQLREVFGRFLEASKSSTGVASVLELARLIPAVLTWPRLVDLSKQLLSGATVDGEACDTDGMCAMFGSDPLELYTALFWALSANYPKYFAPLLEAPSSGGAPDTTPENTARPTTE